MQEKLTIARPYAQAAFGYASAAGDVAAWSSALHTLAAVVEHPQLRQLIKHPRVTNEQIQEILCELLGAQLDEKRTNFIQTLLEADRMDLAPEIAQHFERHKAAAEGVVDVQVESAFELQEAEQKRIADAIRMRVRKDCVVTSTVNPELIGGAVIRVGDSVIDLSLRGRLRALTQRLA
jgi:F-type H+-transporting ATPase subunit delta